MTDASSFSRAAVSEVLAAASVVGFSGSRSPATVSLQAVHWAIDRLTPSTVVVVGCARGVDQAVRSTLPVERVRVFQASSFGDGPGAFAARSIACVRAVAGADAGLWVAFPSRACPDGLWPSSSPAACFSGYGSGTWASLALAVGLGVRCLVFLPPGVSAPAGWPLVFVLGTRSWWQFAPTSVQGRLF